MNKLFLHIAAFLIFATVVVTAKAQVPDTVQSASGISIESSVDRAEIFIGDLIEYKLVIVHDKSIELTPPPIGANLGAFDVKDYAFDQAQELDDGQIRIESRFKLTTFTTGDYIIPPIPIEFMTADSTRKILISEPMPIKIKSLLAEGDDTTDVNDIKPPIQFKETIPNEYIYGGGIFVILVAVILFLWLRSRRKKDAGEPEDTRSAWEIAFEKLAFLKEANYPSAGEFKLYYVELSDIIRDYLEHVYDIPVTDMTTYEFLATVKEREIEDELYDRFKKFLDFADLVKFAKMKPELTRMEDDYLSAWQLIEDVRQARPISIAPVLESNESDKIIDTEEEATGNPDSDPQSDEASKSNEGERRDV